MGGALGDVLGVELGSELGKARGGERCRTRAVLCWDPHWGEELAAVLRTAQGTELTGSNVKY
jgi:hypothetical protein